ncbi:hypothetical protein DL764_002784 [Monosporascus ibericus]|uniref:DUF7918 domain-containing protein n=1 Tax=Monosporascus ibericus TaxID=155417 RepID=A0A4Q4TJ51_9PEZI|nr:hypothetical protein DL764_002784 [Monosporascus ibericus]
MAILEELPGVKVTVRIAGKDCVEYEDPDAGDIQASCPTSSKYIESVDDAEFCIHFHMDSEYNWDYKEHSLCVGVCVDGQMLTMKALRRRYLINQQFDADIVGRPVLSTETGEWFLPIPKFSAVNKVDDTTKDRIEKDREVAKNLGIITVKLHRIIVHDDYFVPVSTPVKSSYALSHGVKAAE